MLNNRGQVLVLFLLILPIFLILFVLVVDIGNAIYEKQSLNNICNLGIDYMKNEKDIEVIKQLILLNDEDITTIEVGEDNLVLEKKIEGLLSHIINIDFFDLKVSCEMEKGDNNEE